MQNVSVPYSGNSHFSHRYFLPNVVLPVISAAPGTSTPASIATLIARLSATRDIVLTIKTSSRKSSSNALSTSFNLDAGIREPGPVIYLYFQVSSIAAAGCWQWPSC